MDWKTQLKQMETEKGTGKIAIIAPGSDSKHIKLVLVGGQGKPSMTLTTMPAEEIQVSVITLARAGWTIAIDGPIPPGPIPGPIGDDTIVLATLQARAAIQVLVQLLAMRKE